MMKPYAESSEVNKEPGVNAFSRYEHGKSKPVEAVVNLFRILDKHPELVEEIR